MQSDKSAQTPILILELALDVGWVKQTRNPPQTKLLVGAAQKDAPPPTPRKRFVTIHHTAFYEPQRRKERQGSQRLYPL